MAGHRPARGGAGETISQFMDRRRRETALPHAQARAVAHAAYGKAIRSGEDIPLPHPSDVTGHGARLAHGGSHPIVGAHGAKPFHVGHPGFAESLFPVWGSAREAAADFDDHNYAGFAFNAALAASDLTLGGMLENTLRKAAAKGGSKGVMFVLKGAPKIKTWDSVRRKMGASKTGLGLLKKDQHAHHWFIPQNGWGKGIHHAIKNHPLNIHPVPEVRGASSREVHHRIHGRYHGKPRFGALDRYWHGTPHWSKVATGSATGHAITGHAVATRKAHRK